MRRLLAVVAAAAMVAGSIAIRSRLDRREEDRTNPLRVVCAEELGTVCDALRRTSAQVTVEPAPRTADRLARAENPEVDGWLAPAPWPQIVDGRRRQGALLPLFGDVTAPLARSPLVIVMSRAVGDRCATGWKCLGEVAARNQAKPGHPDPGDNGFGALLVGQAAAAYFGRVADLSTIDLDDPGFAAWFRAIERATPPLISGGSPLNEMLGTNFAVYDAVGTIEAEAAPMVAAPAVRDRVVLLYPEPMATVDVVLAGSGSRLREVAGGEAVRKALADAGWRLDARATQSGPPLPPTNNLPSPGFLDALRARAEEVRR
jgi:hypothetical protein